MIRKALGLLALGGGIALIACGDDEPKYKYPSSDALCDAKAAEECKVAGPVCAVTDQACQTKRATVCRSLASQALSQGRTYAPQMAEDCIAKTIEAYKDRVPDPVKEAAAREACERVFAGAKKLSEPCSSEFECEGTLICDRGVCSTKTDRKLNEPCNNPGDVCEAGLYCQQRGEHKFCTEKNKLGDACDPVSAPCMEDLRCTTRCEQLKAAGEACDASSECATGLCNTDKKCSARQFPSETGSCQDFS